MGTATKTKKEEAIKEEAPQTQAPGPIPSALYRTVDPRGLQVTLLHVPIKTETIEVKAKIDSERNLADSFRFEDIDPALSLTFQDIWEDICDHARKNVKAFKGMNLDVIKLKRDTRGKGDKKKTIFKFEAVDPTNPDKKHCYHSGEVQPGSLPTEFHVQLVELEAVLETIYRREVLVEEKANQMNIGSAIIDKQTEGGANATDDAEAEEPVND